MRGLNRDTINELVDRKVLYLYGAVTLLTLLIVFVGGNMDVHFGSQGDFNAASDPMQEMASFAAVQGFSAFMSFMVFLTVMATAGLLPRMLEKGRADFYLARPLSRQSLFLNKLIATFLSYGGLIIILSAVVYASMMIVLGGGSFKIIYLIGVYLAVLFVWLCITFTAGILFRSTVMAIMTAFLFWVLQTILSHHETYKQFIDSKIFHYVIDGLYYIIPKTSAAGDLATSLALGSSVESWMPLWSSVIFGFAMIWLALWVFRNQDF